MAYFSISRNDAPLACAGAPDISVLSAFVIVCETGASFGVHGMRESKGKSQQLNWVSQSLRPGDKIEIVYLLNAEATTPKSTTENETRSMDRPTSEVEVVAELERIGRELEAFDERAHGRRPNLNVGGARAPRPRALQVVFDGRPLISAGLEGEEQLQAVLNLTSQGCIFEVDSMTVLESGETKGKRWLRDEFLPNRRLQIRYAT